MKLYHLLIVFAIMIALAVVYSWAQYEVCISSGLSEEMCTWIVLTSD